MAPAQLFEEDVFGVDDLADVSGVVAINIVVLYLLNVIVIVTFSIVRVFYALYGISFGVKSPLGTFVIIQKFNII